MSKEKSGIIGVYAGREVTAQDIANAFSELEAVQQENKELKEHIETEEDIAHTESWHDELTILKLRQENEELKARLENAIEIPDKRLYEKDGYSAYYIDDGEIVEVILSSPIIDRNGKLHIEIFADDCIFPYREPDPEHDDDPQDWCDCHKQINCNELGKTLFLTREEAEKALKEREQNENV